MDALIFPEKPSEYLFDSSYVDDGRWAFGLPNQGQLSSANCGALPFRNGTGLCSPYCLRGEDWVFMTNWARSREQWKSSSWNPPANVQNVASNYMSPRKEQLQKMYSNLSILQTMYGDDNTFSDMLIQDEYDYAFPALSSCLVPIQLSSQPPPDGLVPLELSRLNTFFMDMQKFKCTIADASRDDDGQQSLFLYMWGKDNQTDPAYETENFISALNLKIYTSHLHNERPLQFDVQFIGQFSSNSHTGDDSSTCYSLLKLGDKVTLTQNLTADLPYQWKASFGGIDMAQRVAQLTGQDIHPSPPEHGTAGFTLLLVRMWAFVWPKYLQFDD